MNIIEEIKEGESKTLEFKEKLPQKDQILKTIVAFSNTCGGKLIIGVSNDLEIIGIDDNDIFKLKDDIISLIYEGCYPNILPEIYTMTVQDKLLLVIEVFRGNLIPYYLKKATRKNGVYIRIGATNRIASPENIMELERQRNNISYDEEINYNVNFDSLDLTPIYSQFEKQNKSIDINKLKNMKLIKEEQGKLYSTNALLIILGFYEHSMIKCARFKGTTMEVFTDKKEYGGDIFSILNNSLSFIQNHINLRGEIKGLYRVDTYEIPTEALREALINALIHRDYTHQGRDIKVGIYDDIVNIVSPGCFPFNIKLEDIYNGRSECRNKTIANLFKELELIEKWGTGINRIIDLCKKHNIEKPIISEKNDFIDIEFIRPIQENVGINQKNVGINKDNVVLKQENEGINQKNVVLKQENVGINEDNVGINEDNVGINKDNVGINEDNVGINDIKLYIKMNEPVSAEKLSKYFNNVTKRTIERKLKKLKDENKIEYRGSKKTGGYYSKEEYN